MVSGGNAAPVLEPAEHALDAVALFVDVGVARDLHLSVRPSRDAWLDPEARQGLAEPIAVVALVGDEHLGVGQVDQHGRGTATVTDLTLGEKQYQGLALAVTNGVQL